MSDKTSTLDPIPPLGGGDIAGTVLSELADYLSERGNASSTVGGYLRAVRHFDRWLRVEGIPIETIGPGTLQEFCGEHLPVCSCAMARGGGPHQVRAALRHLLVLLRITGRTPGPTPAPETAADRLLRDFDSHLDVVCGATPGTRRRYVQYARGFLSFTFDDGPLDLSGLRPPDLETFILDRAVRLSTGSVQQVATGLRSFLRFLHLRGECDAELASAVPRVPRRSRPLPPCLGEDQIRDLTGSFDRETPLGRRDYAMTACMLYLGLRAAEVSGLLIDHVDWRRGLLRIERSKSRRTSILPLPDAVGAALVAYLRAGRPPTDTRHVFVRHTVPVGRALSTGGVRSAIRAAGARSGLDGPLRGTHVLRSTAATRMLQGGATIKEIADVLRHRNFATTAGYLRVDRTLLRSVALPWPGASR